VTDKSWLPRQLQVGLTGKAIAPRLYFSYDVTGNASTVIKGGWGRFDRQRSNGEFGYLNPIQSASYTYRWHNPNNLPFNPFDPSQVNLDPNGPDFIGPAALTANFSAPRTGTVNPNEKRGGTDQISLSFEHQLARNLGVRITGVYIRTFDEPRYLNTLRPLSAYTIPITRPIPGPDNVVPTNPQNFITYYEYPTSLAGRAFELFTLTNDYSATETFKSIDVAASKRLSNKWELMASYSATKPNYPIMPGLTVDDSSSNITSGPVNPNAEINTSDRAWEWTGKVSGVYTLPYNVLVSAQFEHRGGYPWARQVLFRGGKTIPSITLNVEPFGTRRDSNTNQLDARFERSFKLTRGHKVSARVSIFNALNSNAVLDLVRQSGPTFMLPKSIMPARIVEFSGSYTF